MPPTEYPLPPGTYIHHRLTGDVYEIMSPGQFRVVQPGRRDDFDPVVAGLLFTNPWFYRETCERPCSGVVEVLDCPIKVQRVADGDFRTQ